MTAAANAAKGHSAARAMKKPTKLSEGLVWESLESATRIAKTLEART